MLKTSSPDANPSPSPAFNPVIQAKRLLVQRELARRDLYHFMPMFWNGLILNWFHRVITRHLVEAEANFRRGISTRFIIEAPPRHSKSLMTTRALTAWFLGRNPHLDVACCSATAELAQDLGREVRATMMDPQFAQVFQSHDALISADNNAADRFIMRGRGACRFVGVEGLLTGFGYSLGIIDDPIASEAEAFSETIMKRKWDWLNSVFMSRKTPTHIIVLMHTRWAVNDIVGKVLETDGDNWIRLRFPAIAEEDEQYRKKGEALQPDRYSVAFLEAERDRLVRAGKAQVWAALYQQSPYVETGDFFQQSWFRFHSLAQQPKIEDLTWVIGCDFAVSVKNTADCTALVPIGYDKDGRIFLGADLVHGRMTSLVAVNKLIDLVRRYKPHLQFIATEKGPLDAAVRPILEDRMRASGLYVPIKAITRTAKKHIHAASWQSRLQLGTVSLPDNSFFRTVFMPQHLSFKPGDDTQKDDLIDACANALMALGDVWLPNAPLPPAAPNPHAEEEAVWDRIMSNGPKDRSPAPFRRLNGKAW